MKGLIYLTLILTFRFSEGSNLLNPDPRGHHTGGDGDAVEAAKLAPHEVWGMGVVVQVGGCLYVVSRYYFEGVDTCALVRVG